MTGEVVLWRIAADTADYEAHDLSGKGAEISGGRWNRKGTPMVYASTSRALACLETLVHLARSPLPLNRYLIEVTVPKDAWASAASFDVATHIGWDAQPAGIVSLNWGTRWSASMNSLLARVPSIIVEEEVNVLLNPRHAASATLQARKVRRWSFDGRLR